jgi:hypothetical protein
LGWGVGTALPPTLTLPHKGGGNRISCYTNLETALIHEDELITQQQCLRNLFP